MRLLLSCVFLAASAAFGSPFRVLVDRPGQWELEWTGADYRTKVHPDSSRSVSIHGVPVSDVAGDLVAPRLQGLVALPLQGDWKLELIKDSGVVMTGSVWRRVPGSDAKATSGAIRERAAWSERVVDGFRLLRMDFPLVEPVAGGVRARTALRLRLTWTGAAILPPGSLWARAVDNPLGIRRGSIAAGARRLANSETTGLSGAMVEVTVAQTDPYSDFQGGVARLTGSALMAAAGVAPGVSFGNIAVYSGLSGVVPVAMTDSVVAPDLKTIPVQFVDRDSDGVLGANDEIRFWVHAPNQWFPDSTSPIGWRFSMNPYTKSRKYLVRLDASSPSPALKAATPGSSPVAFATVGQPVWGGKPDKLKELEIGKSAITEPNLGKSWYWASTENTGAFAMPPLGISRPGKIDDSVVAQIVTVQNSWFGATGADVDSFGIVGDPANWPALAGYEGAWKGVGIDSKGDAFRLRMFGFRLAVAGFQLAYQRDLTRSEAAVFPAPTTGSVDIAVPDGKQCWVIENGVATRVCTIRSGRLQDSSTTAHTWYAYFPENLASTPTVLTKWVPPIQKHVVRDYSAAITADVLVVAPAAFADVAEEYALHRENQGIQVRKMSVAIARSEDIYSLWGGGQMDPAAIRDCIRWAHAKWGVSHVVLLGSGHFDPRSVQSPKAQVWIPHWEEHSVSTDDVYAYLEPGDPTTSSENHIPAVAIGRIPASTRAEGLAWLDKLKVFETPSRAEFGPWRNTVVLAADDVWQLTKPDEISNHTNQSETIGDLLTGSRPWIRQEKLYLVNYTRNSLFQKPEAARDLQTLLNRGVVGLNYMGHGAQTVLADEALLDNAAADRTLVNKNRPFLFYAGSCTVGRNDLADTKGLSEFLVVASGKGAIAAISGTRPSYPSGNARLSGQFWAKVSDTLQPITIGEALNRSKAMNDESLDGVFHNSDIYNILGDPAMVLLPGGLSVGVEGLPDTLSALAKIKLHGRSVGAKQVHVRLEVAPPKDSADQAADFQPIQEYQLSPKQMISIQSAVVADTYSTELQLPARIQFGDSASLRAYAWDPATRKDGGKAFSPRLLRGTATGAGLETKGPTISIRPCDSSWTGGVSYGAVAQIHLPFCLAVDLFDSSGIASETGPDEGVVFSVPGIREPWHPDLRQEVDFRHATAQLVVDSTLMTPGQTHTFDVLARDLMGNLSRSRLQVQVLSRVDYSLYEVFNSPNPVREGENTAFYFKLASQPDSNGTVDSRVQASIRIHTVSGKLVRVMRTELSKATQPRPRAVWDLKDSFGVPVANGIYPYTVVLRIPNATGSVVTEIVRKGVVAIGR